MPKYIHLYINAPDESHIFPAEGNVSLATILDRATEKNDDHISICLPGNIAEQQLPWIVRTVRNLIRGQNELVVLNVFGFSRGGALAFLLAKKLENISDLRLQMNIAVIDPVPVSYFLQLHGDLIFGTCNSLASSVADLSQCHYLNKALVLLTVCRAERQSANEVAFQSPILPVFPVNCRVDVDVMPGLHQFAVRFSLINGVLGSRNMESTASYLRILQFMHACGAQFDFNQLGLREIGMHPSFLTMNSSLESLYNCLLDRLYVDTFGLPQTWLSQHSLFARNLHTSYLNFHHKQLVGERLSLIGIAMTDGDDDCMLQVSNTPMFQLRTWEMRKSVFCLQLAFLYAVVWGINKILFAEVERVGLRM